MTENHENIAAGVDFSGLQKAADNACATIDQLREERSELRSRVHDLETVLARMVAAHDETVSNTEGRYPTANSGCIECTLGTVPDHMNKGLCAYHRAKELLPP